MLRLGFRGRHQVWVDYEKLGWGGGRSHVGSVRLDNALFHKHGSMILFSLHVLKAVAL